MALVRMLRLDECIIVSFLDNLILNLHHSNNVRCFITCSLLYILMVPIQWGRREEKKKEEKEGGASVPIYIYMLSFWIMCDEWWSHVKSTILIDDDFNLTVLFFSLSHSFFLHFDFFQSACPSVYSQLTIACCL